MYEMALCCFPRGGVPACYLYEGYEACVPLETGGQAGGFFEGIWYGEAGEVR